MSVHMLNTTASLYVLGSNMVEFRLNHFVPSCMQPDPQMFISIEL